MASPAVRQREAVTQSPRKAMRVDEDQPLLVKKLSANATLPQRGSAQAAGYDLSRCACASWSQLAEVCIPDPAVPGLATFELNSPLLQLCPT